MRTQKSEYKAWAKNALKGIQNCIIPSFTPDTLQLDERGIRWDVQQSIRHGFVATLCVAEAGLTMEEAKRFVEIVADEAKGNIIVSTTVMFDTLEHNMAMIRHAAQVGCQCAFIDYPHGYYPQSEEEIYQVTKDMCAAADLGIFLHALPKDNFRRFHPSGYSPALLSRLAAIENVVGAEIAEAGLMAEYFRVCGDTIVLQCPLERWMPLMVQKCGLQLLGPGTYELFQSPEKPYLVDCFNLLQQGEYEKAMDIYWMLSPVRMPFEMKVMQMIPNGAHPLPLWKYYQWLTGGNGGFAYSRMPIMEVQAHDMMFSKQALMAIGIPPREPDEEFFVGRVNYAEWKARSENRR